LIIKNKFDIKTNLHHAMLKKIRRIFTSLSYFKLCHGL